MTDKEEKGATGGIPVGEATGGSQIMEDILKKYNDLATIMTECQQKFLDQQKSILQSQKEKPEKCTIKLNKFTGVNQNFSDYLIHFETVSKFNDWKPERQLSMLVASLNDQALEFISAYDWKTLGLTNLISLLKGRFDKYNLESVSESEFYSFKKEKKVGWPEVVQKLQVLASRAFSTYGSVAQDALVCRKMLEMLSDSDLKKQLLFLDIKNPKELCDKIMTWDSLNTESSDSSSHSNSKKADPFAVFSTFEKKLSDLEGTLMSMKVDSSKQYQDLESTLTSMQVNTTQYVPVRPQGMRKRRCYGCGILGHILVNCPHQNFSTGHSLNPMAAPYQPRFTYSTRPRYAPRGYSQGQYTPRNYSQDNPRYAPGSYPQTNSRGQFVRPPFAANHGSYATYSHECDPYLPDSNSK